MESHPFILCVSVPAALQAAPFAPLRPLAPTMAAQRQLASVMPAEVANHVNAMCEAAPGIPWSDAMLEDMLVDLKDRVMSLRVIDLGHCRVQCELEHVRRCKREVILAGVSTEFTDPDSFRGIIPFIPPQPYTIVGLRRQLECLQKHVAMIHRRGWCEHCAGFPAYRTNSDRPFKRLKVQGTDACSICAMSRIVSS